MECRLVAVDYGEKRIGIAISDPLKLFAKPLKTIPNLGFDHTCSEIEAICAEYHADRIIVGVPYSVDGNITLKTQEVLDFIDNLKNKLSLPILGWDERWTTAEANKILEGMGYTWKKSRAHVDAFAACLILKSYMEQ